MEGPVASLHADIVSVPGLLEHELERHLQAATTLAFRVAWSVLRDQMEAEDVAQDAVVKAYEKSRSLRDRERFRPWLVRIAWRLALDRRRARGRRERREGAVAAGPPGRSAEEAVLAREREEKVWEAVESLPEKLRVVVVLGAMEGHDVREVAALLGVPEGTVKSRLHLARRRLAESLRCLVTDTTSR
jgi:RNA polymerase sigma-70 factor (ECF subfamily)